MKTECVKTAAAFVLKKKSSAGAADQMQSTMWSSVGCDHLFWLFVAVE